MQRAVPSAQIVRAWDKNGDGELGEAELLFHLAHCFRGYEQLWEREVTPHHMAPPMAPHSWPLWERE